MSNSSETKKEGIIKTLAIIGFIGIIIFIAWLSVRIVAVVPSAFSSLASIVESINQPEDIEVKPLTVTSNSKIVNSGDSVTINWISSAEQGTYTFSYNCVDGVDVDIVSSDGTRNVECSTNYNVGDTNTLTLFIKSNSGRYADVSYEVSFLRTNEETPSYAGSSLVTIVNSEIQDENTPEEVVEETPEEEPETVPEVAVDPEPVFEQEFVYIIPVSNPNGFVDITTRFLSIGDIVNNRFVAGLIKKETDGAIQFEIRNVGTKTSEEWTFTLTLPNGGEYESPEQKPLKPNERAVLTVGFIADDSNAHRFEVDVKTTVDRNNSNNDFSQLVPFIN